MIQALHSTWIWAIAGGSGNPFMFTTMVQGLGGRNVTAEASLAKVALSSAGAAKHVKATVWHASTGAGSVNWGIDGPPLRFISNVGFMSFALEVAGPSTFAWMTAKVYVH